MTPIILDLETTTVKHLGRTASPFCKDNWIVAAGWQKGPNKPYGTYHTQAEAVPIPDLTDVDIIVAHNAKFDLLYLWQYPAIRAFFKRGGRLWCTQLAEYLIEGMHRDVQMNSLNQCALKYGGNAKIDAVKEMWEAGVNTPDIPKDLLMDYLLGTPDMEGDIGNTYRVYNGQLKALKHRPKAVTTMIHNRMESLLATTEMEYNGLFVNREVGEVLRKQVAIEVAGLRNNLLTYIPKMPEGCVFNWNSVYDKSALFYGGTKKYSKWVQHDAQPGDVHIDGKAYAQMTVKENVLVEGIPKRYKSGKRAGEIVQRNVTVADPSKPKGAQKDHFFKLEGYTHTRGIKKSTLLDPKGGPIYSTDADTVEKLGMRDVPFTRDFARYMKTSKDLSTYYWEEDDKGHRTGMLTQVGDDGIIHHGLNHTSTVTGRMSSSKPNLQNVPRKGTSEIKKVFESRFGKDGYIVEMDYSALEVYVQAVLMNELKMQSQIASGIDFHCHRLSMQLREPYASVVEKCKNEAHPENAKYDAMRTAIKGFSFQLAYGAGAPAIAAFTGMEVESVKELIVNEQREYPALVEFDNYLERCIKDSFRMTSRVIPIAGVMTNVGEGTWTSPTGTKYTWYEGEAPAFLQERGQMTGFKSTERKNYPVQGFGGEIMQTMLGVLWRWFISQDHFGGKALLVNTVHDSAYLDIHKDVVHQVVPMAVRILASVKQKFNNDFDLGIPIDFKVDAEIGTSMYHEQHYDPNHTY